jgi:hypothetical protein
MFNLMAGVLLGIVWAGCAIYLSIFGIYFMAVGGLVITSVIFGMFAGAEAKARGEK